MAEEPKSAWEQRLHETATAVEEELRRVIAYINDEVVPEVREHGSRGLRSAAAAMERLAERMDDRKTPPPPPGGTPQP